MMPPRYTSRIKFFDSKKGYGFILPTDTLMSDVFLPENEMADNYRPQSGDMVEFSTQSTRRGTMAVSVVLVRQRDESLGGPARLEDL